MFSENDFWIPTFKYQYVAWLCKNYATDKKGQIINWNKFPLKRLKAIYIGIRKDNENAHDPSDKSVRVRQNQIENSSIFGDEVGKVPNHTPMVQAKKAQICFDFGA